MKARIFYRTDGGITVRRVNKRLKAELILIEKIKDSDTEFFDYCQNVLSPFVRPKLVGATYEDIEEADLPVYDSATRNKWRKKPGGGVHIDNTVVTRAEKRQKLEDDLDAELLKPNTDMKKAMLLSRILDKGEYD